MEPIRVLQVVTTMERAGLETMLMNYYRNVDRTKVQFDFLRHRDGEHAYDSEIRAMGGRIYTVPPFNPLNTNGYLTALNAFFRERPDYQIVHAHLDCLSAPVLRCAKRYGVPTRISHSHVSQMTFDAKYPIRMFYRCQIPAVATDMFACSEDAGKWMFGKKKCRIVPNAIDCECFAYDDEKAEKFRRENGLEGCFVVGHVGRFDPVKNHVFLLKVFREIAVRYENSVLLLAGTGDTMAAVRSQAEEYGLAEKVHFLGSVSNVPEILQMMDVFVFPSLYEGLGISLIEAQAAGLPCYAALDCVPNAANVTGDVRYLSLNMQPQEWADIILRESSCGKKRESRIDAIRNAGYDIKVEARKLEEFYLNSNRERA